jgi:hypothetical protein
MRLLIQLFLAPFIIRASLRRSHDYLDANSGSMILQVLLGGTAGVAVVVKMFWHRLGSALRFGRNSDVEVSTTDE